jgi:hypothetical protein
MNWEELAEREHSYRAGLVWTIHIGDVGPLNE